MKKISAKQYNFNLSNSIGLLFRLTDHRISAQQKTLNVGGN
jgi:hypothetical protein